MSWLSTHEAGPHFLKGGSDFSALACLAVLFAIYTALFYGVVQVDVDIGRDYVVADELLQGKVLYRDNDYWFGPLTPWLHAGLFRTFGTSVHVILVTGAVVSALILVLVYAIARYALGPFESLTAAWIILAHAVYSPHLMAYAAPYTLSAVYGLACSLIVLYGTLAGLDRPRSHWDWIVGAAAGLALAAKQDYAILCAGVIMAGWAARYVRCRGRMLSGAATLTAACAAVVALFAAALFRDVTFAEFRHSYYPVNSLETMSYFYENVKFSSDADRWLAVAGSFSTFVLNIGFVMAACALLAAAAGWLRGSGVNLRALAAALLLGAPFVVTHAFLDNYPLALHVLAGVLLFRSRRDGSDTPMALIIFAAAFYLFRVYPNPDIGGYALMFFAPSVIVYLWVCYRHIAPWLGRWFDPVTTQPAMGFIIVTAFILYPLARTTLPWRAHAGTLETDRGVIHVDATQYEKARRIVDGIHRFSKPGDTILTIPEGAMYTFLTARRAGSRFFAYTYGNILDGEPERAEIRRLAASPPRLIVVDNVPQSAYFEGLPNRFGEAYNRQLSQWIEENYREAESFPHEGREVRLLVPRASSEPERLP